MIFRLTLGSVFIYSGFYKVTNPQIFSRAVENLGLFSKSSINILAFAFPWIELILGALLITGLLARKAALGSAILLIFFILITVFNSFRGNLVHCGCFPEYSILNSSNPFIATIRNFILLTFGGLIIVARKDTKISPLIDIKGRLFEFTIFGLIAFSLSILLILIGTRRFEKKYVLGVLNARQQIMDKNKNLTGMQLSKLKLNNSKGWILLSSQLKGRFSVLLILDSLECKFCIEEAIYLEKLNRKFGGYIQFCAIVGKVSCIAIDRFKKRYALNYTFLQDLNSQFINKFAISNAAIKVLVSPSEKIVNIDPPVYGVKSIQNDFESVLQNYMRIRR